MFKVSFQSGTGHDDPSEKVEEPHTLEFDTHAERAAFLQGVSLTSEAMDGWVDAWVETKIIDEEPEESPHSPEDLLVATNFLDSLKGKTAEEVKPLLHDYLTEETNITTPRSYSKLNVLCVITRELRGRPDMDVIYSALKEYLLESM